MNAETVLKILEVEKQIVVYRRPLNLCCYFYLCPGDLALIYRRGEDGVEDKLTLWKKSGHVVRLTYTESEAFNRTTQSNFVNFLANWSDFIAERRWAERAPSLGEIARIVNAYARATGYRLFTLVSGEPLTAAEPYEVAEIEEMHEAVGYDS